MKIGLFLSSEPSNGGVFQYNMSVLNALLDLPQRQYQPVIAYSSEKWAEYIPENLQKVRISISSFYNKYYKKLYNLGILSENMKRVLYSLDPVILPFLKSDCKLWIFPTCNDLTYRIPVAGFVAIHDLMHRYERRFSEVSSNGIYEYREKLYKNTCRWAKGILVDSETGKQHVIESYGTDSEKINVLPYIPPPYIYQSEADPDFEKKYSLPAKYLFYPAQFWAHKNHINLLKAVATVKRSNPDISIVFVGSKKNNYEKIVELIEELDLSKNVLTLDYVSNEDVIQFYKHSRALIMTTYFGPTNIPPLEAMALGCPVGISDIYAHREQTGDAALYFNPDSVEEIASVINILWTNEGVCCELKKKGKERSARWGQKEFNLRFRQILEKSVFTR